MDIIYTLVTIIISTILFGIIFDAFNQSFNIFEPLNKLINKVKRKKLLRGIVNAIGIILCVAIKEIFNLNLIEFGILISFFSSLSGVVFGQWKEVKKISKT